MPRWTTREVAKIAGVSPATVSRVLNNQANVAAELAAKVRDAVRSLEQGTDPALRALPAKKIAAAFPRRIEAWEPEPMGVGFYGQVMVGVDEVLRQVGYDLSFVSYDPLETPAWLTETRFDGIILMGADTPDDLAREAGRQGVPVVVVDKQVRGVDSVVSDNLGGAEEVTAHVITAGYRTLIYLCETFDDPSFAARRFGFERAVAAANVAGLTVMAAEVGRGWLDAPRVLHERTVGCAGPVAVVAGNDMTALHILGLMRAKDLPVPDPFGLAGFDDVALGLRADPPLTTVRVDKMEMGRLAARRLLERLTMPDLLPITITMHVELVVRGSTKLRR